MKFLDLTLPTPAKNLACDEALLEWRETSGGSEILRFWESPQTFVVAGYANKIEAEVNTGHCEAWQIPILRRCSGGGAVLQGRGCLNYALILKIAANASLASISSANKFIMERNGAAVQSVVGNSRMIKVQGHTDLACAITPEHATERESARDSHSNDSPSPLPSSAGRGGMVRRRNRGTIVQLFQKFSGNSQRRHKNYLLFHGTFLLDFDLSLVDEYLKFPSRQPDYRSSRAHGDFLVNLHLPAAAVKAALQKFWQADEALQNPPLERIDRLAREKYTAREWNLKF